MGPDEPAPDDRGRRKDKRRRRRRRDDDSPLDSIDGVELPAGGGSGSGSSWGCGRGRSGRDLPRGGRGGAADGCDGCDGPCDGPCDVLLVLRLSTWLLVASALVPEIGGALVCAILRGYQRRLTRFTPSCPQSPSCSAFTLGAVESLGPRHGLAAAARRIQSCGPVHGGSMSELASESSTQRSREAATERSEGVR